MLYSIKINPEFWLSLIWFELFIILLSKFEKNLKTHVDEDHANKIIEICSNEEALKNISVVEFMSLMVSKIK